MWAEERQRSILNLVKAQGRVETDTLAETLSVSRETVRRDLLLMEGQRLIRRVHGGVVSMEPTTEPSDTERRLKLADEKKRIAKAAAQLLRPGQACFVDCGTTTGIFASELAILDQVDVITNSIEVATVVRKARKDRNLTLIGGQLSQDATANYGELALDQISRFNADLAIISPVGIDPEKGLTYFGQPETEVARVMQCHASRTLVLADHTKLGLVSRMVSFHCRAIDTLITDKISDEERNCFLDAGVNKVIRA